MTAAKIANVGFVIILLAIALSAGVTGFVISIVLLLFVTVACPINRYVVGGLAAIALLAWI